MLPTGKRAILFSEKESLYAPNAIKLPCGQCIGCRLEKSRQWALRCMHEASRYQANAFVTLTFNDENLPDDLSVKPRDWQLYMKRLRKRVGSGIRYYMAGEYGELCRNCARQRCACICETYVEGLGRPHYHGILFNYDYGDKVLWKTKNGNPLYVSKTLEKDWQNGFAVLGNVTFESAAYVARYVMKKVTGVPAASHYERLNAETGELLTVKKEFNNMSRGSKILQTGGIGKGWIEKYHPETYPVDNVVMRGREMRPSRFYDNWYEKHFPDVYEIVKLGREKKARRMDSSVYALQAKELVLNNRLAMLKRNVEA